MKKKWTTELTVKKNKTKMTSEIEAGKPLEPKEVKDYECPDIEIDSPKETLEAILKLSGEDKSIEDWLKEKNYTIWSDSDWNQIILDSNQQIIRDIVYEYLYNTYSWRYAYLKKGNQELYWQVSIRNYKSILNSPYGRIHMPLLMVDSTPVFFDKKWLLTEEEKNCYELYNNKDTLFDQMELEKKIMHDLILYTTNSNKTLEQSKDLFERIKEQCETVGTIDKIEFKNWVMRIYFGWRLAKDSSWKYGWLPLPPFDISIDFINKSIICNWEHPHNMHPSPCLWGELTRIKDSCFRDKDIYWLTMGMIEFGNSWTSTDADHTAREPGACIRNFIVHSDSLQSWEWLSNLPIDLKDIIKTVSRYDSSFFAWKNCYATWLSEWLENEENWNAVKQFCWNDWLRNMLYTLYVGRFGSWEGANKEKYEEMVKRYSL